MATIKQTKAFKEVVNGSTLSGAMTKAGYGIETSKRTNKLTKTKGWEELMKKHLPDSLLVKKHRELLNKKEVIVKNNNDTGEIEVIPTGEIDVQAVTKGLDMAYKLKGSYVKEDPGSNKILIINISPEAAAKYAINPSPSENHQ